MRDELAARFTRIRGVQGTGPRQERGDAPVLHPGEPSFPSVFVPERSWRCAPQQPHSRDSSGRAELEASPDHPYHSFIRPAARPPARSDRSTASTTSQSGWEIAPGLSCIRRKRAQTFTAITRSIKSLKDQVQKYPRMYRLDGASWQSFGERRSEVRYDNDLDMKRRG